MLDTEYKFEPTFAVSLFTLGLPNFGSFQFYASLSSSSPLPVSSPLLRCLPDSIIITLGLSTRSHA